VSISAQTLLELGVLRTKEGMGLLATAVVDDVLAILLLSVVIATMGPNTNASAGDIVWILVKMTLYLGGSLAVAWFVLPRLFHWLHHTRQLASGTASFALVAALLFGWSAEVWGGVAAITGTFIAGVGLSQTNPKVKAEIENAMRSLSYTFLVPIFFINVGLHADLTQLSASALPMTALLVVVAVVTKIAGSGIGARLGGFNNEEAFRLGVCMISRGEVGLIIASLGLSNGLLETDLFQPLFVVILLSTVLTPPLVRLVFRGRTNGSAPQRSAAGAD
jgi:Kef-type K+ transport system membrane component KefB